MSFCSTSSSNGVSGFSADFANGYRFTTTRSTSSTPCDLIASRSSGRWRRARIPPWIFGCSVLTRPSIISGKPVMSETLVTGSPASARAFDVPPVDTSWTPRARNSLAKSIRPALSETLRIARILGVFLDTFQQPPLLCLRRWRASVVSRGRALAVFFYVYRHCKAGKYDAHHRQGQVVQQRQGLRVH